MADIPTVEATPQVVPDPPVTTEPPSTREDRTEAKAHKAPGRATLPYFSFPNTDLAFGRKDSTYTVVDHPIQIANQAALPTAVYNSLATLVTYDLPITVENFTRMWRTILLKRAQDIYESAKHVRSEHFVRFTRNIMLPGPLGDLVHSLGYFHSTTMGVLHHVVPPARASTPPTWWTVNAEVVAQWCQTMETLSPFYVMKEFPSLSMTADRPLMLTFTNVADGYGSARAFTNEVKMTDGLIRLMNDDLFDANDEFAYATSHLLMTRNLQVASVRSDYVNNYITLRND